jgi:hypothetical protein
MLPRFKSSLTSPASVDGRIYNLPGGHTQCAVVHVTLYAGCKRFVSAAEDGVVIVWDAEAIRPIARLQVIYLTPHTSHLTPHTSHPNFPSDRRAHHVCQLHPLPPLYPCPSSGHRCSRAPPPPPHPPSSAHRGPRPPPPPPPPTLAQHPYRPKSLNSTSMSCVSLLKPLPGSFSGRVSVWNLQRMHQVAGWSFAQHAGAFCRT